MTKLTLLEGRREEKTGRLGLLWDYLQVQSLCSGLDHKYLKTANCLKLFAHIVWSRCRFLGVFNKEEPKAAGLFS